MKRKSIGIDLDDTLNCLIDKWILDLYNSKYNDNLSVSDIKSWDIDKYVKPECGKDIYKLLATPHLFRELAVKPYAPEVVRWLQFNYDVYIISAAHFAVCGDKGFWLKEKFPFIPYENIIFCCNKNLIHTDYLIDDGVHNLEAFTGQGILFDAHHNQGEDRFPRMNNWLEIKKYFEKEMKGDIHEKI